MPYYDAVITVDSEEITDERSSDLSQDSTEENTEATTEEQSPRETPVWMIIAGIILAILFLIGAVKFGGKWRVICIIIALIALAVAAFVFFSNSISADAHNSADAPTISDLLTEEPQTIEPPAEEPTNDPIDEIDDSLGFEEDGNLFDFDENLGESGELVLQDEEILESPVSGDAVGAAANHPSAVVPASPQAGNPNYYRPLVFNYAGVASMRDANPHFRAVLDSPLARPGGFSNEFVDQQAELLAGRERTATLTIFILGGHQATHEQARAEVIADWYQDVRIHDYISHEQWAEFVNGSPDNEYANRIPVRRIDHNEFVVMNTFFSTSRNRVERFVDNRQQVRLGIVEVIFNEEGDPVVDMETVRFIGADCRNLFWFVPRETPDPDPRTVSVTGVKVWADNNNEHGFRPVSVEFQLRSGSETGPIHQ
ncbi:hypothetical protein FWD07_02570, partial [Candidatus Saccharibacteria bacterium]|nr:hypothetical protein [Candidatus Saccharibacteria bacterium]